jgi:hypothetical protein
MMVVMPLGWSIATRDGAQHRISWATSSSPRAKARVRAMASRGPGSPGASASKTSSTRSAQSAAHAATIRRSASLSVCGKRTIAIVPPPGTDSARPRLRSAGA